MGAEQPAFPVPTISRYEILDEIGRGGMGVVYRAYEPALERPIALKLLSPELARQPSFIEQLRLEAVRAARLRHPHIALLYEFGQEDATAFLAMEYIEGRSLRQMLERGSMPFAQTLRILEQIGQGLEYAHRKGIVHRDVKPGNILVTHDDHAMLIDFGLADVIDSGAITVDSAVLGTPHYISPEQAAGYSADARSDQYALGAVAYELLTGVPPFHGRGPAAVIHAHIYEPPAPPTELRPTLPIAVNDVVLRALAKQPHQRYGTIAAFLADLQAAMAQVVATPQPLVRQQPLMRAAAILAVLALLIAVAFGLGRVWTPGEQQPTGLPLPRDVVWTYDFPVMSDVPPVLVGSQIIISTIDGGLTALDARTGEQRWQRNSSGLYGVAAANNGMVVVGKQQGEVVGLSAESGGIIWRTPVTGRVQSPPTVFAEQVIFTTTRGYVYVVQSANGSIVWSRPLEADLGAPVVGGGRIILRGGTSVYALDLRNGVVDWQADEQSQITTVPVIADDTVVVGTSRGELVWLGLADGRTRARSQLAGAVAAAPASADGLVLVGDRAGWLTALGVGGGERWRTDVGAAIEGTPLIANGVAAVGTSNGDLLTLDLANGAVLQRLSLGGGALNRPVRNDTTLFIGGRMLYAIHLDPQGAEQR